MAILLGFDIGGTKLGIGLGDSDGKLLGTSRRDNRNTDPAEVLPWMVAESKRLIAEAGLTMDKIKLSCFHARSGFPIGYLASIFVFIKMRSFFLSTRFLIALVLAL